MSIFQCVECGCAENTALGWYHSRNNKRLTNPDALGEALCSSCAPTEYHNSDECTSFNGKWHDVFGRVFLPYGEFFTNCNGNLEHKKTGLIGNKAYEKFGSKVQLDKSVTPCKGKNCKTITANHSEECIADYDKSITGESK